jgi:hypothetical protein
MSSSTFHRASDFSSPSPSALATTAPPAFSSNYCNLYSYSFDDSDSTFLGRHTPASDKRHRFLPGNDFGFGDNGFSNFDFGFDFKNAADMLDIDAEQDIKVLEVCA